MMSTRLVVLLLAVAALLLAACGEDRLQVEVQDTPVSIEVAATPVSGPTVVSLAETVVAPVQEAVEELGEIVQTAPPVQTAVTEVSTAVGLPGTVSNTITLTTELQELRYSCPSGQVVVYSLALNPLGDGTYALTRAAGDWISVQIVGPNTPVQLERGCEGQGVTQVGELINGVYTAYNVP